MTFVEIMESTLPLRHLWTVNEKQIVILSQTKKKINGVQKNVHGFLLSSFSKRIEY